MKQVGVIGLGDMGSGLAKNLLKAGFATYGFDLSEQRMQAFIELGGQSTTSVQQVGENADAVFIMVMTGDQAKAVIFADDGLVHSLKPGAVIILTATITATEARDIGEQLIDSGIELIDSPVSGGFPGAQSGTLTMMAAGKDQILDDCLPVMPSSQQDYSQSRP